MPSLKDLEDEKVATEFAASVVAGVRKSEEKEFSLNHGDCFESALLERVKKGREMSFDYKSLMDLDV